MKGLYFIKDKVSSLPYSSPIMCENDKVALVGFQTFLEKQENAKPEYFELYRLCTVSDDFDVMDSHKCFIAVGNEAKEVFEKLMQESNNNVSV